jgi:hypothetical protein
MEDSARTADEASAPTWVLVVEQKQRGRFACRLAKRARGGAASDSIFGYAARIGLPGLCCSSTNCMTNHNPGCTIEAEVMSLSEMMFYLAQQLSLGITAGLPSASLNSQVETAESEPSMICFLILSGLSIHGLPLPC